MSLKRWLYLTHRWIGIVSCLFFAMWFASGLVMLYVPFPSLSASERLAGIAPIDWAQVHVGPGAAGDTSKLRQAVLEMRGDRPVWRLTAWDGVQSSLLATDGRAAGPADEAEARRIGEDFGKAKASDVRKILSDQWTVAGSFDAHRPLWKVHLSGEGGRVLYVSSVSGAVVLDTNRFERGWNWVGSVPHWLYPRALREDQPLWRQVVIWVSGPCIIGAVTGLWIGILRVRLGKRRFKGGRFTPYRGWMKWHHVSGLVGSVFLILWIFSGWLSVDPGRFFASNGISPEQRQLYDGFGPMPDIASAALKRRVPNARRITVFRAAGQTFLRVEHAERPVRILSAATLAPAVLDASHLHGVAAKLVIGGKITQDDLLTTPDAYWYALDGQARLPVRRLRYDDPAETWVYIDPDTGEILSVVDFRRRAYRWMFDLFHRWDFGLLLEYPPARHVLIWIMSAVGISISVTSIYIAWARLSRRTGKLAENPFPNGL